MRTLVWTATNSAQNVPVLQSGRTPHTRSIAGGDATMKRIDLHTHAKLSKTFPFAPRAVWQFIARSKRLGLDGVALVEHLHAVDYWGIHEALRREFRYRDADGVYEGPDGFRLLSGAELSILEGCDLIVLGTVRQLQALDAALAEPPTGGYRPPFDEAIAAVRRV